MYYPITKLTAISFAAFSLMTATAIHAQNSPANIKPRDGVVESLTGVRFAPGAVNASVSGTGLLIGDEGEASSKFIIPSQISNAAINTNVPPVAYNLSFWLSAAPYGNPEDIANWPLVDILIDNVSLGQPAYVGNAQMTRYDFVMPGPIVNNIITDAPRAGMHNVTIKVLNAPSSGSQVRKLTVHEFRSAFASPPSAKAFSIQGIAVKSALYPPIAAQYQAGCDLTDPALTGCANIQFIKDVGANDVTFATVCKVMSASDSTCVSQLDPNIAGQDAEIDALKNAIRFAKAPDAKGRKLGVTLKVFVVGPDGEVIAGYRNNGQIWTPSNPAQFFDSLKANLLNHANLVKALAFDEGVTVDRMMIGTEMGGRFTSGQPIGSFMDVQLRWRDIIRSVRQVAGPTLKLTYSATAGAMYNDIDTNEAPYLCFWDKLDYIGINAYPDMNYAHNSSEPPVSKLGTGFGAYRRLFDLKNYTNYPQDTNLLDDYVIGITGGYPASWLGPAPVQPFNWSMPLPNYNDFNIGLPENWEEPYGTAQFSMKWYVDFLADEINARLPAGMAPKKVLLTEVGAPSSYFVQGGWGPTRSAETFDPLYWSEQAKAWDGYLRAFYGDPRIAGIHMWGLQGITDARQSWSRNDPTWKVTNDFYGKPETQEVVCRWFKNFSAAPCYRMSVPLPAVTSAPRPTPRTSTFSVNHR